MKTFVKHVYDVDIINIYHLLDNKLSNDTSEKGAAKKKDFLERLSYSIKQIIESDKGNDDLKVVDCESIPSYVITPKNNFDNYIFWLGLFLLSNPSYKTNLILEYHHNRWTNKMKFLNSVEFYILDRINKNDFIKDELVLKTVSEWILFKRLNVGYLFSNTDSSKDDTKNKAKTNKNLILINKKQYETEDIKSPEEGDPLESATENQLAPIRFSNKIVIDLFCEFIKEISGELDEMKIITILNFKPSKNKIKLIVKLTDFLNVVKALQVNDYLIGGYGIQKIIAKWIHTNFEFSKTFDYKPLYKEYTIQDGKPLPKFPKTHNELIPTIKEKLLNQSTKK